MLIEKIVESERLAVEDIFMESGRMYTFLNPVSYLMARKKPELFRRFDGIFADGSLLAMGIRMLYGAKVGRRSFDMTSLAGSLFESDRARQEGVYLIGASEEEIAKAVNTIRETWPKLRVVGSGSGYFNENRTIDSEIQKILTLSPAFVVAGLGTGLQEHFLLRLRDAGYRGIGFTCGGFLSQIAKGGDVYYPNWIDRCNLRFIYRFLMEPHTRGRYMRAFFLFPLAIIRDRLHRDNHQRFSDED